MTTIVGAVINMVLNISLTPIMGIKGTAAATAAAFLLTWFIQAYDTRKFVSITYPVLTFMIPLVVLIVQSVLLSAGIKSVWIQLVAFMLVVALYWKSILHLSRDVLKHYKLLKM